MQEQIRRLKQWQQGEKPGPYTLEISPTLRCNLNCKFCWRRDPTAKINRDELHLKRYQSLFQEAKQLGVEEVRVIGGGEPFFHEDIMRILRSIKDNDLTGYICTNGTLLAEERCQQLIDIGWDHVKFSLHGLKKTHDQLVEEEGAFSRAEQALKRLNDSQVEVEIGMVVVKDNYDQIENLLDWATELGINFFFLEPVTVYSDLGQQLTLNEEEREDCYQQLRSLVRRKKLPAANNLAAIVEQKMLTKTNNMKRYILSQTGEDKCMANAPCYEPFLKIGVRVDGRVAPCGFYDQERGDSIVDKTLREVWHGDYFEARRQEQLDQNLPDYCSKCCTTLVEKNRNLRLALD